MTNKRCLVTGGCGFIGSALVRHLVKNEDATVLVVDNLSYAGVPESLIEAGLDPERLPPRGDLSLADGARLSLFAADICDSEAMARAFARFRPDTVFHLAAQTHVDRSIDGPAEFVRTNVAGTAALLDVARAWWRERPSFVFQHISTDEVYGALGKTGAFTEETPYAPHSPYSATKAAGDHLVRAWRDTYGLPVLITNCSNNYGPYQFPEKLIPLTVLNALEGKEIPVYGDGANVRDWLYVDDHVGALCLVNEKGTAGETYNVGGGAERTNLDVVTEICAILDERRPRPQGHYADLIRFVGDRPGHDLRYAVDSTKLRSTLGWQPQVEFSDGLRRTVDWYLENGWWWNPIRNRTYAGERLGCAK